jgi:GNAT superfamily N-acetyltransferase
LRAAKPGDAPELAELSAQLGYPASASEVSDRLASLLGQDDHLVLVAVDGEDRPIGWIHAVISRRIEYDAFAELGGMVVSEGFRSAGIGASLLAAAEDWARTAGVDTMRVRSNVTRDGAHRFYESHGYEKAKTSYVFQKRL